MGCTASKRSNDTVKASSHHNRSSSHYTDPLQKDESLNASQHRLQNDRAKVAKKAEAKQMAALSAVQGMMNVTTSQSHFHVMQMQNLTASRGLNKESEEFTIRDYIRDDGRRRHHHRPEADTTTSNDDVDVLEASSCDSSISSTSTISSLGCDRPPLHYETQKHLSASIRNEHHRRDIHRWVVVDC